MISIASVLFLLFVHWAADFVAQNSWMAQEKSKNNLALLAHVSVYSGIFYWALLISAVFIDLSFWSICLFIVITFVCHFITDYFTSRLNTYLWNKKDIHHFFVSIGADQWAHACQLILTYHFCFTK